MSHPRGLTLLLLLVVLIGKSRCDRPTGVYVDNGFDQTVVHKVVTEREKRELEHEILNLLGLPERPPKVHASSNNSSIGSGAPRGPNKRSAPSKFLLDIYTNALDEEKQRQGSEFGLSGQDLRAIEQSDVIMSFAAHNHHVPGLRHERGKRLWFDVSEATAMPGSTDLSLTLLGAELRLYRSPKPGSKNQGAYTLTAYRVLGLENNERELQFVDAVNASAGRTGWLTLNVTAAVRHWVRDPAGNRGLYLSVHPADRRVHEVRPEDVGIAGFKGQAEHQPFMVGFFKSSAAHRQRQQQQHQRLAAAISARSSSIMTRGGRAKREAKKSKGKKSSEFSSIDYRSNPYADPQMSSGGYGGGGGGNDNGGGGSSRTCKIQTLYVNFRDLQWQDWIIAPDGYDAYYCSGECNFPLNAHMNATNHAIVQTLVHLVNPGKVPKPCCAPTKLSPISVLYYQDESNVILRKYKNMAVKSCGCH
ncbi:protein 60A-like [Copidosoma floridanum]|uniref:protein 60A-like n=1 Tax=Copidosoma floridanum TaxID=29053 RepID=UPI0006C9B270|nr:protein 60A-like [Copidosoma floridanum]